MARKPRVDRERELNPFRIVVDSKFVNKDRHTFPKEYKHMWDSARRMLKYYTTGEQINVEQTKISFVQVEHCLRYLGYNPKRVKTVIKDSIGNRLAWIEPV